MSLPVCMYCPSTTAGCEHTNPYLRPPSQPHLCPTPEVGHSLTTPSRPDWTCGICGRVWRLGGFGWWQEIRGPSS